MEAQTANLAMQALSFPPGNARAANNCGQLQPHIPNCCSRHCPASAKSACAGLCSWLHSWALTTAPTLQTWQVMVRQMCTEPWKRQEQLEFKLRKI